MDLESSSPTERPAAWLQLKLSIGLLALVVLAFGMTFGLVRSRGLELLSGAVQEAYWQAEGGRYAYHPLSLDSGDYLLQRVVPELDLSAGGVVFIGSSTMQHALVNWKLPAQENAKLFNLAVESTSLLEQGQWLRFLVAQHGLGKAKPGHTTVVMGLYHGDARSKRPGTLDWDFVPKLFARYPEYSYQVEQGIHWHEKTGITAEADRMRQLVRSGLLGLKEDVWRLSNAHLGKPKANATNDPIKLRSDLQRSVGTLEWNTDSADQVAELQKSIKLLRDQGVEVVGVLLPTREFSRDLPLAKQFNESVKAIFSGQGAQMVDLTQAASETHFADGSHLNYVGQHLVSQQIVTIAREALARQSRLRLKTPA